MCLASGGKKKKEPKTLLETLTNSPSLSPIFIPLHAWLNKRDKQQRPRAWAWQQSCAQAANPRTLGTQYRDQGADPPGKTWLGISDITTWDIRKFNRPLRFGWIELSKELTKIDRPQSHWPLFSRVGDNWNISQIFKEGGEGGTPSYPLGFQTFWPL